MNIRVQQLDVLRGIAILLILGRHTQELPPNLPSLIRVVLTVWQNIGWMGVDLFFVLSGFLVTGLILAEQTKSGRFDAKRFLIRRGFKIYPSYYILLATSWLVLAHSSHYAPFTGLAQALFIQNYYPGGGNYPIGHTWSLAVEEYFYLLLAIVGIFLHKKFGYKAFLAICFIGVTTIPIVRAVTFGRTMSMMPNHLTHLRIDALLWGALLAYMYHFYRPQVEQFFQTKRRLCTTAAIALLLPSALYGFQTMWLFSLGLAFEQIAFCLIIMLMLVNLKARGGIFGFLSAIGIYSYSIYLWHGPVGKLCYWRILPQELFMVQLLIYWTVSVLVGIAMAKIIEIPALRLRDKYFPRAEERTSKQPAMPYLEPTQVPVAVET